MGESLVFDISLHSHNYPFVVDKFFNQSNSDIKRLFEQNAVKCSRSYENKVVNLTLKDTINQFVSGDWIIFGNIKSVTRIILEVESSHDEVEKDYNLYRWVINNKERIYNSFKNKV